MDEGAAILSLEGGILYCNRRFAEMLRSPISNILGRDIIECLEATEQEKFHSLRRQALGGIGAKTELDLRAADGSMTPVIASLQPLAMQEVQTLGMIITDLTEQKKTAEVLKQYSQNLSRKNVELQRRAEQLARMSSELTLAEKRERKRMSQVLHDGLQQMLASAKMQLSCMIDELSDGRHKRLAVGIEEILSESITVSRSLCMDLSPPVLHEGDLADGLEWLVRAMDEKHRFRVELCIQARAELPEDIKILLYESVRELLFNAVKHARVHSARLQMGKDGGDRLRVSVSDDGSGFDTARLEKRQGNNRGFGLSSIRERLELIGGALKIESAPGKGSSFTISVPIRPSIKARKG